MGLFGPKSRPSSIFGVEIRGNLFPGEDGYFRQNPHVGGMAAEDDRIVINPYSSLSDRERAAVYENEAARVLMRRGDFPRPSYEMTPEQMGRFGGYSANLDDIRQTFAARILSGDPSAVGPTPAQKAYAAALRAFVSKRKR